MSHKSIFEIQADFCRRMSNPARVEIIHILQEGPHSVTEIARITSRPQPTISRHLGVLRDGRVVIAKRQGQDVIYQVANPKITGICNLLREALIEEASGHATLLEEIENKPLQPYTG